MGEQLTIETLRAASPEEWDQIWQTCETATYFHSREWSEVWSRYKPGVIEPDARLVVFSDGVRALLPVSRQRLRGGRRWLILSSPDGTYGGWLGGEDIDDAHAALLAEALCGLSRDLRWRLNPFDVQALAAAPAAASAEVTHTLDLQLGFAALQRGFSRGHRSAANKARRAGVRVECAVDEGQWRAYFEIYGASRERWGARREGGHQWPLFSDLSRLGSSHVDLWLATIDEKVICGALCFSSATHVVYWHGAALADYFPLRPATLLMSEIIRVACEDGYRWFDFNPSAGLRGVVAFKERFGAQAMACPEVVRASPPMKLERMLGAGARRLRLRRPRRAAHS